MIDSPIPQKPVRLLHVFDSLGLGGTERVVINRAHAAQRLGWPLAIDFHVPGASAAAIAAFEYSVRALGLDAHLRFVPILTETAYDAVFILDFPAIQDRFAGWGSPVVVEAHQARRVLQAYLADLPPVIRTVVVPSSNHADFVRDLLPPHARLRIVPNAVTPLPTVEAPPSSAGPMVLFCGRMGAIKDTPTLMAAFAKILQARGDLRPTIVTPTQIHADTEAVMDRLGLRGRVTIHRNVPFCDMGAVYRDLRASDGVLVSCSKAESFGLAAAEAICAGAPAVLADIDAHRTLVDGDARFLFPVGDADAAADRILAVLADVPGARTAQAPAAARLSDERGMIEALWRVLAEVGAV